MNEKKETYCFNAEENAVVKMFTIMKNGVQIASGFSSISDEELLQIYEADRELAEKDGRLEELLHRQEEPVEAEPTEMEQLQADIAYIKMKMKGM
ncbi:MAG: hypothetical protein IKY38_01400 [Anaerotignum sp.]|nr:hypothetical protein [Anaerotignum sp.]